MRALWGLMGLIVGCRAATDSELASGDPVEYWSVVDQVEPSDSATATADGVVYSTGESLLNLLGERVDRSALPAGPISFLADTPMGLLAHVHGVGLFRDDGSGWQESGQGLSNPLLGVLNASASPVPYRAQVDSSGVTWLASAGGLFRWESGVWTLVPTSLSGSANVLFTDVALDGDRIAATAVLPESIIPSDFVGLLSGTVFLSEDGGTSWQDISEGLPSLHVMSAAWDGPSLVVGTQDQGVWRRQEGVWSSVSGAPSDALHVRVDARGLTVGSASRGVFQQSSEGWHHAGEGGVLSMGSERIVLTNGEVLESAAGPRVPPPDSKGGRVYIALSFHGNYYHSYRGDSPTDDGFGKDIDVITQTLDWLDAYPAVHAEWDFDNAFTTDDWMPEYSPELMERISERVADGRDDIRLMSWNNGAMAGMTREEFEISMERAKVSNAAAFGAWVPGVQPQENMFSPAHIGWYSELGIDWITMFYSANGFTSNRLDVRLDGAELYNPITVRAPESGSDGPSLLWVPVYHHADVMEHGGLLGWSQQLHDTVAEDTLLVIHFDADAETWENFDVELAALEGVDFVEFTNIQDYLDAHGPVRELVLDGEYADGTGDGFQSWAEKDWNHRLWTDVMQARRNHELATFIGIDQAHPDWFASMDARLLALSTTNYGLAMPTLHPDRVASATQQALDANEAANRMWSDAQAELGLAVGEVAVIQPRNSSGMALHEVELAIPDFDGSGVVKLVDASGAEIEAQVRSSDTSLAIPLVSVSWVGPVTAESIERLSWEWDPSGTPAAGLPEVPELDLLGAPFLECEGKRVTLKMEEETTLSGSQRQTVVRTFSGEVCGGVTTVEQRLTSHVGLDFTEVELSASVGATDPTGALQSVVLTPLYCEEPIDELSWRAHSGDVWTRPARAPVASWNGQAADGWISVDCGGNTWVVAHDIRLRSSMAFMPVVNQGPGAMLAPLGTLWAPSPLHDGRRTGGNGLGDIVVPVVGSQFAPAAPDWAGQSIEYRLWVSADASDAAADVLAHPPSVISGI